MEKKKINSFFVCMLEKPFPIFCSGNIHSEEEGEVQKVGGHLLARKCARLIIATYN